jgi:uncharacterized protein (TIGR03435 family)
LRERLAFALVGFVVLATGAPRAQAPPAARRLAFDVSSIKENTSGRDGGSMGFRPGGTFAGANIPASSLVHTAFTTNPPLLMQQIVGLPGWAASIRYDITAKIPADAPQDAAAASSHLPEYVRSLLEDRFAFKGHMDKQELPIYALTIAASGSKLRPSTLDCSKAEDRPKCLISFGPGRITGAHLTLANLLGTLAGATGRPVLDRTNLGGAFDVDLQWAAAAAPADASDDRASIFVAVQEQLGLKLESARAPMDVLVVDHLERPTEN